MKTLITSLLILCCSFSFAQKNNWPNDTLLIRTDFSLGDHKSYDVTNFFKTDDGLFGFRSESRYRVDFEVFDTAQGGYWIQYSVRTISSKENRESGEAVTAFLANGISIPFFINENYAFLDSASYFKTKKRVTASLDSVLASQSLSKDAMKSLSQLQAELKKDDGLAIFLGPLTMFTVFHTSGFYKKYVTYSNSFESNIFFKPLFSGLTEKKWTNTSGEGIQTLTNNFIGDREPAAKYYRPIYKAALDAAGVKPSKYYMGQDMRYTVDHTFKTRRFGNFPVYIYRKSVSDLLLRSVGKIEMKEVYDHE